MSTRHSLNPNDADYSDSSDSSYSPVRVPRRSATVSPSTRNSFFHYPTRRRSDFNLNMERDRERRQRKARSSRELSEGRRILRKTNSEPNVEGGQQIDINALRKLLDSLPKYTSAQPDSDSGGEDTMTTEIEELRDAAKSIQSLQRVLKLPQPLSADRGGISTRLGHPRGVMQFLPSMRETDQFLPSSETYRNRMSLSRKTSAPDGFLCLNEVLSLPNENNNPRPRRRGVVDDLYSSSNQLLERKASDSLAGVSRFTKLLKSFRSRPNSPDQHPTITWSPYVCSESASEECRMEDSLLEADILLWKKRSRASLRRHFSVRNLAARELLDTEKSFVEGLEFLVTKYMRPLRQPLECTLIEPGLVDKIFYKIPEILAHHQVHFLITLFFFTKMFHVLLAALSSRIESWHKESVIGDVLLSHFAKQSMIETFISFVDNFKYAKGAITQARGKPSFEKYYSVSQVEKIPNFFINEIVLLEMLQRSQEQIRPGFVAHFAYSKSSSVAINQHKEANEQMEQRLREIEAIVDGLDDVSNPISRTLVSTGRNLVRYDMIIMRGKEGKKQRCVFTLSDQLVLTSVRRKNPARNGRLITQSTDFLDSNRFKLLIKISLDDVEIAKDTLAMLQETESAIDAVREDEKVIRKVIELANLIKGNKEV
uniref:DH domain-containing protein n=1 Tax=Heterorhabditis bacteriophora TaxID=37862 RepID=A0A1I7X8G3_HETBA